MKKWLAFLFAALIFVAVHEGTHAVVASLFGELKAFQVRPLGLEVVFRTPTDERVGIQWALISGMSNVLTLVLGYSLLMLGQKINGLKSAFLKAGIFYLTLTFLLVDAFNLSIGPFIYGGDVNGIAVGLGINRYLLQAFFLMVMLVNRELIARKLFPAYKVKPTHLFLKSWVRAES